MAHYDIKLADYIAQLEDQIFSMVETSLDLGCAMGASLPALDLIARHSANEETRLKARELSADNEEALPHD